MVKAKRDTKTGLFTFSLQGGKNTRFEVILESEEEGGYSVHRPALKGCHSQGQTVEEALANIKEAIEGCLLVLNEKTPLTELRVNNGKSFSPSFDGRGQRGG